MRDLDAAVAALVDRLAAELTEVAKRRALEAATAALRGADARPVPNVPRRVRARADGDAPSRTRTGPETATSAASERILKYVADHPGQRAEAIRAALRLSRGVWTLATRRLEAEGKLKRRGERRNTMYWRA